MNCKSIAIAASAALALTATLSAEQYDRLLDAIDIPDGAYFDTGYVVKDHPRVIASISVGELDYDFDLFGVKHRSEGCWILNVDGTTTDGYHPAFYYRHGTAGNNGGVGEYSARQRLDIDCGKTLVVNGEELQSVNNWDFSSNETTMTIPGTEDAHRFTLIAFQIWDGGVLVRDFLPAERSGVCGLYDRVNDQFYAPNYFPTASGTVTAACGERVDAICIPNDAYFETGCVVKNNPRVIADVSADWTTNSDDYGLDVFGVKPRSEGCWILNLDVSVTSGQSFYYRYGTASSGGPVGSFSAYERLLIDCGKTLVVNGIELQTFADYDFSNNDYQMRVPGNQFPRYGACTLRSFKIEDGGRLVRDFVPAVKNGECGLFDRVTCQFYTSVGTGTVTAEPYDRLLEAIHIPSDAQFDTGCAVTSNPRVIADVSADTTADFDLFGVKTRSDGCWILNLDSRNIYYRYGTAESISLLWPIYDAGQRFQIDCGKTLRVNGTALTTANDYDFSGNATTMTIPGEKPGGCTIWSFNILDGGEYARVFLPAETNGVCGLYDRVNHQFYAPVSGTATPVATAAPTGLKVRRGDYPNPVAVLSWRPALGSSGTSILRAPGTNGPWTEVAQVGEDADTYVDASAPAGALCHYRVAANFPIGGDTVSVTNETSVAFRRWRLLERDAGDATHLGDMGHLRSGVNIIYNCDQEAYTPAHLYTWEAVTNSILLAFNNVLYRPDGNSSSAGYPYSIDYVDVADAAPSTCIGVDLGEAAHVAHARFHAVTTVNEGIDRIIGLTLYGSNDANWIQDGNHTALIEPFTWRGFRVWHDNDSLDTANTYRYLYYTNPRHEWGGNVSEIQFYGWLDSDLATVAQSVEDIVASYGSAAPSVTLTWTPAGYGTYTVERKTGDDAWEVVASGLPAATTSWTDSDVTVGTLYTYRVTTVNGADAAYSADCTARPYLAGNGVGLHGEWWTNYVATTGGEALALVTTNAMIDIANASVGGEAENLFIRWSGRLIAPLSGDYAFDADGGICLWIDGNPVLYHGAPRGTMNLTAGEHDVTVAWRHGDGMGSCRLYWSGSVERAVIPASQLVPVAPRALPDGWTNARSFDADAESPYFGNVTVNADGSLDFAHGGRGIFSGANGYNFLWQPVKGDFTLTAKMVSLPVASQPFWRRAGLMVRSSLDASAMMSVYGVYLDEDDRFYVQSRQKTATDPNIVSQSAVAGAEIGPYAATPIWVRLIREGNRFTCLFRSSGSGDWLKAYEYEDVNGEYGKTVYAGLATWGDGYGSDTYVPYYPWRFSDVRLVEVTGFILIIK